MEDIHRRRLSGSTRIPSVEVDAITEGMVLSVIIGIETGEDWWLHVPVVNVNPSGGLGHLDGAPSSPPPWGAHSCPASMAARQYEVVEPCDLLAWQSHHDGKRHASPLTFEADESVSLHKSHNLAMTSMAK